jgi:hypothetical protein
MRVLLRMKPQISWQEQDLNQLAASQLELPRERSGTGLTEITKKHWESTIGLKQAKGFISGPSAKRTMDLYSCF